MVFLRPLRWAAVLRRLPPWHRVFTCQGRAGRGREGVLVRMQTLRERVSLRRYPSGPVTREVRDRSAAAQDVAPLGATVDCGDGALTRRMVNAPPSRPRTAPVRGAVALLATGLALVSIASFLRHREERRNLDYLLERSGLVDTDPSVAAALHREDDPVRARLGVARALLAQSLDPRSISALGPRRAMEWAAREEERLDLVAELAMAAAVERPVVWQSPMLQGAATYLGWARRGDPRLFSQRSAWETPLRRALALAPGYPEPRLFLAGAFMEVWSVLSPAEREEAQAMINDAFTDETTFRRLIGGWLRVVGREQAFESVPRSPAAWSLMCRILASAADWDGYIKAWWRWDEALAEEVQREVRRAESQLRGGDLAGARAGFLRTLDLSPPDRRFAHVVERALTLLPAGTIDRSRSRGVRGWLTVGLESFAAGDPVVSPDAVARLARLAGDVPLPQAAMAQLAAGNRAGAEAYERRSEALNTEPWGAYCLAKARWLLEHREREEAGRMWALAHGSWREGALGRHLGRHLVGDSTSENGLTLPTGGRGTRSGRWSRTEWRWREGTAFLWLDLEQSASGLTIDVDVAPRNGAVVAVRLGWSAVATETAAAGGRIVVSVDLEPGVYLLEHTSLAGGRVIPGDVSVY